MLHNKIQVFKRKKLKYWRGLAKQKIAEYGPNGEHPTYSRPGLLLQCVDKWSTLSKSDREDLKDLLSTALQERNRQPCCLHTIWNDFVHDLRHWQNLEENE